MGEINNNQLILSKILSNISTTNQENIFFNKKIEIISTIRIMLIVCHSGISKEKLQFSYNNTPITFSCVLDTFFFLG